MKKLIVVLFLICIALAEWQQSSEIALPKTIQVNDLAISFDGELWILSSSSLLKIDAISKNPVLIQEISNGKILAAAEEIYILDNLNRLHTIAPGKEEITQPIDITFNNVAQVAPVSADDDQLLLVREPNQLIFSSKEKILGSINTNADKFAVIPLADYSDTQTPFFTLLNNRIYSWQGGTFNNAEKYRSRLMYSATNSILDLTADQNGALYVLFADSIVVLGSTGEYKSKLSIENLIPGSRILTNPAHNNLVLFDRLSKTLRVLSNVYKGETNDLITLNKNQPNPVDNYTEIEFTINQPMSLVITVYNLIGRPVKVIAKGYYQKGTYRVTWHAEDENGDIVPNGVYFYRLESEKGVAIRQLIVLR